MTEKYKLYVGNISYDVTSKDLIKLFSKYGEVMESMVIPSNNPNKSKGYGFVSFSKKQEADKAVVSLNGADFQGRNLVVKPANEQR